MIRSKNRKGVLSSVATAYDPLGFASPLLLLGKEISQELCRLELSWETISQKNSLEKVERRPYEFPRIQDPEVL